MNITPDREHIAVTPGLLSRNMSIAHTINVAIHINDTKRICPNVINSHDFPSHFQMVAPVGIDPTTAADEAFVIRFADYQPEHRPNTQSVSQEGTIKLVETIAPLASDWMRKVTLTCESLY